jgi:hypothetical protein
MKSLENVDVNDTVQIGRQMQLSEFEKALRLTGQLEFGALSGCHSLAPSKSVIL